MPIPVGWDTREPLCGENDPYGREDTANKYVKTLWTNFTNEHNADDGTHKTTGLVQFTADTYDSSAGDKTISLPSAASGCTVQYLEIYADLTQYPVCASADMSANDTKELGTAAFQSDMIKDITTAGEFTVGQDDAVNAQGSTETYYYCVWYA